MIAVWMVYAALVAALVAAAALLAERGAHALRWPTRWLWIGAIAASLVVPAAGVWWRTTPAAGEASAARAVEFSEVQTTPDEAQALRTRRAPGVIERLTTRGIALARTLDRPLLGAWVLGSLAMLGFVLVGAGRLAGARREWPLALVDDQFVRVSQDTGPAVIGVARCEIVLPAWALSIDDDSRALLLAHEREHVRARDPLLLLVGLVAVLLAPWSPVLWWQLRRLRLAVEMDCDARVLRACSDVRAYGALLIEVGRRTARAPLAAAAFSEPATHLERRIHMMLARPPRWRALRALVLGAAGLVLAAIACDLQAPVAPNPQNEVALAELGASGGSYNVKEGAGAGRIQEVVAEHFPELIGATAGTRWTIQIVQGADGRIVSVDRHADLREVRASVEGKVAAERAAMTFEEARTRVRVDSLAPTAGAVSRSRERQSEPSAAERERRMVAERRAAELAGRGTSTIEPRRSGDDIRGVVLPSRRASAGGALSRVRADDIESIEVVKGGALSFSGAISGVIWIRLKTGTSRTSW